MWTKFNFLAFSSLVLCGKTNRFVLVLHLKIWETPLVHPFPQRCYHWGTPPPLGRPPPYEKKNQQSALCFLPSTPHWAHYFLDPTLSTIFIFPQCFRNCILNGYFNEFRTQDVPKCTKKRHLQLRCGLTSKFERALHFIFI